jgi:hypothetical protein
MRCVRSSLVLLLALLTVWSSPAFAQDRHIVDPSKIAAAVSEQVARSDADRAAVRQALARPEMKDLARSMGVDLDRATASVATLSGPELERAASAARQVADLTGGASTVTISTTTIILILLVIILLIVALK